jgi:hypothetical protein
VTCTIVWLRWVGADLAVTAVDSHGAHVRRTFAPQDLGALAHAVGMGSSFEALELLGRRPPTWMFVAPRQRRTA